MPVEDQCLLGDLKGGRIHLNLCRSGESSDTVLAVDSAKGSFQGCRTQVHSSGDSSIERRMISGGPVRNAK